MIAFSRVFVAACFLVFVAVWFVMAFSAKRTVERSGYELVKLGVLVALLAFAMERFNMGQVRTGGGILWQPTSLLAFIGDMLTLAGLLITLWARRTLGGNWSGFVAIKENHELIQGGPYAYVRHPIYSGAFLMVLGSGVLAGRTAVFKALALLLVAFVFKSLQEEALLTKHFPEAYPEYKARVKAFIPSFF
jgi:protein-S-isoprenylcysteine O-methyltransferase Ste14